MTNKNCELAGAILQNTNDGDDLAPEHLKLLEMAVNGVLNDLGNQMFTELHATILNGQYIKPWLQGVEHLTQDHEGYVYWKDHHIEHWSGNMSYSESGKTEAAELSRRCRIIEARGETPSPTNVVWNWLDTGIN